MFCNQCGKQLPDNSPFCQHCGAAQAGVNAQNVPVGQGGMRPPQGKSRTPLYIVLGVVTVAAVVLVVLFATGTLGGGNPMGTNNPFLPSQTPGFTQTASSQPTPSFSPPPVAQYPIQSRIIGKWEYVTELVYYGCEFFDDGSFLAIEQDGNNAPTQDWYTYGFISEDTMILDENPSTRLTVTIQEEFGDEYLSINNGSETLDFVRVDELHVNPVLD